MKMGHSNIICDKLSPRSATLTLILRVKLDNHYIFVLSRPLTLRKYQATSFNKTKMQICITMERTPVY